MSPTTRRLARLIGELESVSRRLKNLIEEVQGLEADSKALYKVREYQGGESQRSTEEIFREVIEEEE